MKKFNNKGVSAIAIVLIVIVIILAGGAVWWGFNKKINTNSNQNINSNVNGNANTNTTNQNTNVNITIDPVTGWNIYTNDKYSYRLKFPKEWQLVQIDNDEEVQLVTQGIQTAYIQNYSENLDVYHPQKGEINVDVHVYKISSLSLTGWFDEYLKVNRRDIYFDVTTEQTAIDGNDAIIEKITTGKTPKVQVDTEWLDGKITNYYIKHNQQVLELSAVVLSGDENLLNTADQIARSLEFTNNMAFDLSTKLDTANWQKYTNSELGFFFLYPSDYGIRNQEGNTLYITKKEYIDRETETPIFAISWEKTKPNDLEKWIRDKGINDQLIDLPQPLSGKAYQYEYAGNAIHREAYIQLNENLINISLGAWFDYDMLDVFNTIMFSLKAE
ncbi:MAG: hypothetical protein WC497_02530 [Patescibacteria group bacterium]